MKAIAAISTAILLAVMALPTMAVASPSEVEEKIRELLNIRQSLMADKNFDNAETVTFAQTLSGQSQFSGTISGSSSGFFGSGSAHGQVSGSSQIYGFSMTPTYAKFVAYVAAPELIQKARADLARWTSTRNAGEYNHDHHTADLLLKHVFMSPENYNSVVSRFARIGELMNELELIVPFEKDLPPLLASQWSESRFWAVNSRVSATIYEADLIKSEFKTAPDYNQRIYKDVSVGRFFKKTKQIMVGFENVTLEKFEFAGRQPTCVQLLKPWR